MVKRLHTFFQKNDQMRISVKFLLFSMIFKVSTNPIIRQETLKGILSGREAINCIYLQMPSQSCSQKGRLIFSQQQLNICVHSCQKKNLGQMCSLAAKKCPYDIRVQISTAGSSSDCSKPLTQAQKAEEVPGLCEQIPVSHLEDLVENSAPCFGLDKSRFLWAFGNWTSAWSFSHILCLHLYRCLLNETTVKEVNLHLQLSLCI